MQRLKVPKGPLGLWEESGGDEPLAEAKERRTQGFPGGSVDTPALDTLYHWAWVTALGRAVGWCRSDALLHSLQIAKEDAILPVALFPSLCELIFHNNPLVTHTRGMVPANLPPEPSPQEAMWRTSSLPQCQALLCCVTGGQAS